MTKKNLLILLFFSIISSACKDGASGLAESLLCASSHDKGKLTVGLNYGFFQLQGFSQDSTVTNDDLKTFLNDTLAKANVDSDILNVEKVESVGNDNDIVRFLEFGGSFSAGFGIVTDLVKGAIAKLGLTTADEPFDFINESFKVNSSRTRPLPDYDSIGKYFKNMTLKTLELSPNDEQWALKQTEFDKAKELYDKLIAKYGKKKDPVVAVLDTGIDDGHPDLKDIITDSYDPLGTSTGIKDENGHGTHCAGIIASQGVSDASPIGVATMANAKIMPIKVLGKDGGGDFQAIEKGIRWAIQKEADVISMSLGAGLEYKDLAQDELANQVIQQAIDANIIVVVAAGNESCPLGGSCETEGFLLSKEIKEYTVLPCAYEGTICVGATNPDDTLAEYSNYASGTDFDPYRKKVDVNAPGTLIYSTWPRDLESSGFKSISGTSMATPYIAGIAAVLKSIDVQIDGKDLNQELVNEILKAGQSYPSDVKDKSNEGRVDLYATLVAFANRVGFEDVEEQFEPEPAPVEEPENKEEGAEDPIASLWNVICN